MVVIISILASIAGPAFVFKSQAEGSTIVINELMWMGSSVSSADEWIELRNLTDQPIDLSNWQLTKKSSGVEAPMLTIPAGKSIPAQGFFVIANYESTNASSVLGIVPDYVNTDVALSNSALQIKLFDANNMLIDTADDGVGNPLSGKFDSGTQKFVSMERNVTPGDGTIAQNWHAGTKGLGFKMNAAELGTPGSANSNALPVAHAGPDQTGIAGQEINFDGSDSSDPEGQTLTYVWNFGDGISGSDVTPKHTYAAAGEFTATLTVSDGTDTATDTAKVTIAEAPVVTPTPVAPTPIAPAPASPPTPEPAPTAPASCRGLHLSELYPNPPGIDNDEFIELVNSGDEEVTTGSCTVAVGLKTYPLPTRQAVPTKGFVVLKKSENRFTLTNTGATIKLIDSDGTELDRTSYEVAAEGKTWARFGDIWEWTLQPTAHEVNVLTKETEQSTTAKNSNTNSSVSKTPATTKAKKSVKEETPAQSVSLADMQQLDSGDKVIVRGVVTAPVGLLGPNLTFIQSDGAGTAVVIPNGEPALSVGNEIEVTGTVRLSQGRRRVAAAAHGIKVLSTVEVVAPMLTTAEVGPDQADQLVHVKGIVALASGNSIEIDDGSGPLSVYLKSSTGIIRPKLKAGDTVDAVGIVNVGTTGVRVWPRGQEDLKVERVLGASTVSPVQTTNIPSSSPQQSMWYWIMAGLGGLGAAAKPAWNAWSRRKLKVEG